MKILKILGGTLALLLVLAAAAWLLRTDPMGPVAGRALSGEERAYPEDWAFTNDHMTIAVETRPATNPHSVTTICFMHDGALYVPAGGGSDKNWTHYAVTDPQVRIKVGDAVYPARLTRVTDADPADFLASAGSKYSDQLSGREIPDDLWLFRVGPR